MDDKLDKTCDCYCNGKLCICYGCEAYCDKDCTQCERHYNPDVDCVDLWKGQCERYA